MPLVSGSCINPVILNFLVAEITKYLINTIDSDDDISLHAIISTVVSGMTNGVFTKAIINAATGIDTDIYSGRLSLAISTIVGIKSGIACSNVYLSKTTEKTLST